MPMPTRVDWAQIKDAWPADERCVAILDRRAIHILLSIFPRFSWAATFDHSELAADDWDYIQRIVADAEYELGIAMPLSELIPYIDEIESLLRALDAHSQCCGEVDVTFGDGYTDPVEDGVGNVPQNIVDAGYASSTSDWTGFADYKCMISHLMIDSMELSLRQFIDIYGSSGEIIGGIGSVAAIIGTIFALTGPIAVGIIGALGAVGGVMATLLGIGEAATEALADSIADNHDQLACAIYQADGSQDAVDSLKATIDDLYSDANALLLKNMNLDASLKALYAGRYDQQDIAAKLADSGYDTDDYTCVCTETPVDVNVFGLRWDYTMTNSGNPSLLWAELPYDTLSINTANPFYSQPGSTGGDTEKWAIGETGIISSGDADRVYVCSAAGWREDRRWLWWRIRNDENWMYLNGSLENFEVLISDGEGGYYWVSADMTIDGTSEFFTWSETENKLTIYKSGSDSHKVNAQTKLTIQYSLIPPY